MLERAHGEREASAQATVVLLREQAMEFPPSWKQTRARLAEMARGGVRLELLARDDVARLLALESLLCAARSGDVEDGAGRPLLDAEVTAWIRRELDVGAWPIARMLDGRGEASPEPAPNEPSLPAFAPPNAARPSVEACLAQLGVASVDRLVREVVRVRQETTRAQVLEALDAMGTGIRWFGRSIVARRTEAR